MINKSYENENFIFEEKEGGECDKKIFRVCVKIMENTIKPYYISNIQYQSHNLKSKNGTILKWNTGNVLKSFEGKCLILVYQPHYQINSLTNNKTKTDNNKYDKSSFDLELENKELIGFASYDPFDWDEEGQRHVVYIYEVHTKIQRRGIGSHLLKMIEKRAKELKQTVLMLTTLKNNEKAKKFYLDHGFTVDASDPSNFYKESDDINDVNYEILSKILPE